MAKGQEEYFFEGVIYAACLLVRLHDHPGMAADVIKEVGLRTWDCSGLEEYEKEMLRVINREKDMELRGL